MAANMIARISLLHKTEKEWAKLTDFVPAPGEIVLYDPDENYEYVRLKAGDGKSKLSELGFFVDAAAEAVFNKLTYSNIIDAGRI